MQNFALGRTSDPHLVHRLTSGGTGLVPTAEGLAPAGTADSVGGSTGAPLLNLTLYEQSGQVVEYLRLPVYSHPWLQC